MAERLGIKPESARKTAQRRRWHRTIGNDGTVRVQVPVDVLNDPRDITGGSPTDTTNHVHIQLARLATEIEGLREVLASERRRANAAEVDRDRWHAFAMRPWWKRTAG